MDRAQPLLSRSTTQPLERGRPPAMTSSQAGQEGRSGSQHRCLKNRTDLGQEPYLFLPSLVTRSAAHENGGSLPGSTACTVLHVRHSSVPTNDQPPLRSRLGWHFSIITGKVCRSTKSLQEGQGAFIDICH